MNVPDVYISNLQKYNPTKNNFEKYFYYDIFIIFFYENINYIF